MIRASVNDPWANGHTHLRLDNIPDIFNGIAELATCYAGAQAVIADADGVVLEAVCKIIIAFSHCANEDANTLFTTQVLYVVFDSNDFSVKAESYLSAIGGEMISDGILDDFEEFFL